MPIFEYRCSACNHLEEVLQKHDDPAPDPCPHCGKKRTMKRELSLTSFQLKGGGWYKDLYSSTKPGDGGSSSSSSDSSTSSSASTPSTPSTPSTSDSSTTAPAAPAPSAPASAKPDKKKPKAKASAAA
ncbi:MAG TPA: zinc ribbon domain-containing protein [Myxococcota bacterium]